MSQTARPLNPNDRTDDLMAVRWQWFHGVLVVVLMVGCQEPEAQPEPIRQVRAVKVGDLKAVGGREFPGRARAKVEVELSFQVSGPLVSLPVDVGTVVKKGDLIAAIDPRDFQTDLDSAQGNLDRAKANLLAMERGARAEEIEQLKAALAKAEALHEEAVAEHQRDARLIERGAVSQQDFDRSLARQESTAANAKSAQEALNIGLAGARPEDLEAKRSEIRALEAAVAISQNQLDDATLTAPFDGEIVARYVDNFQTVQAKQPIVRMVDLSEIEITVQVPESLIALVPQVKQVACRFDAIPDREFIGQVAKIGSEASQTTRTYPVTVRLDQPEDVKILPGMAATVRNQPDDEQSAGNATTPPIIPPRSVFTDGDARSSNVWVVDAQTKKVSKRTVTTGNLTPVGLEVTEGLRPGEWVVTDGVNSLRPDQEVKLLEGGN